ncbi:hypothetical protein QVD17_07982 [Tagetes erecta]|uniref:HAT C-terminal dimerisation domain-containing protein n=1 Tax=Tagetes erecta TaxID=13708 RepID=A0AAD8P4C5_TARER|nr:hypothetical protein QVD17_07982 [Tagetes erecta]
MYKDELSNTFGVPEYADWKKVRDIVYFLHVFYRSSGKILESHVTSNIFLDEIARIDFHLDNWGSSFDSEKSLYKALGLLWIFSTYCGHVDDSNLLIYIASILDPCQKTDCMEQYFLNRKYKYDYSDEGRPMWKKKAKFVVATTYDLFNEYAAKIGASHQTAMFRTCGYMSYLYDDTGPRGLGQKREVGFGGNIESPTEIDIYLAKDEDFPNQDGFDILLWWKANSETFPVLSKMARDVLAIPISAVPLESDINTDGNFLDDFKSSLSPSMVEALVCTQDWMNKSKKQNKVDEGSSSTTLADKILKGIYEQLEGAAGGSG